MPGFKKSMKLKNYTFLLLAHDIVQKWNLGTSALNANAQESNMVSKILPRVKKTTHSWNKSSEFVLLKLPLDLSAGSSGVFPLALK